MRAGLRVFAVLLLFIPSYFSLSCRTCKNADCFKEDIPLIACTKNVPVLPFQVTAPKNKENLQYGCLQLEYLNGNILTALQQCIVTEDINTFCTSIAKNRYVVQCIVFQPTTTDLKKKISLKRRSTYNNDKTIDDVNGMIVSFSQNDNSDTTLATDIPSELYNDETTTVLDENSETKYITTQQILHSTESSLKPEESEDILYEGSLIPTTVKSKTADQFKIELESTSINTEATNPFTTLENLDINEQSTILDDLSSLITSERLRGNEDFLTNVPSSQEIAEINFEHRTTTENGLTTINSGPVNSEALDLHVTTLDKSVDFITTEEPYLPTEVGSSILELQSEFSTTLPTNKNDVTKTEQTFSTTNVNFKSLETTQPTESEEDLTTITTEHKNSLEDSTTIQTLNSSGVDDSNSISDDEIRNLATTQNVYANNVELDINANETNEKSNTNTDSETSASTSLYELTESSSNGNQEFVGILPATNISIGGEDFEEAENPTTNDSESPSLPETTEFSTIIQEIGNLDISDSEAETTNSPSTSPAPPSCPSSGSTYISSFYISILLISISLINLK